MLCGIGYAFRLRIYWVPEQRHTTLLLLWVNGKIRTASYVIWSFAYRGLVLGVGSPMKFLGGQQVCEVASHSPLTGEQQNVGASRIAPGASA